DYHARIEVDEPTEFIGYTETTGEGRIVALLQDGQPVARLEDGAQGAVVLDRTPFYGESGGQVGDTGTITLEGDAGQFHVTDTQKQDNVFLHFGRVTQGALVPEAVARTAIDAERRQSIKLNHTGTHLLHAALRDVLGTHVQQKGSLVAPDRLRFDFSHFEAVDADALAAIETQVNDRIRDDIPGQFYTRSYDDAMAEGAMAFFDEKYGDQVRVVRFGDYSVELCGGTHVERSGEIGLLKLTEERGVAAGVRRVEAITGAVAIAEMQSAQARQQRLGQRLKASPAELEDKLARMLEHVGTLEKQITELSHRLASSQSGDLAGQARDVDGIQVIAHHMPGADRNTLRETVDALKSRLDSTAVVLGTVADGKVALVAGVSQA